MSAIICVVFKTVTIADRENLGQTYAHQAGALREKYVYLLILVALPGADAGAQEGPQADAGADAGGESKAEDDVTDVEFEEVNDKDKK